MIKLFNISICSSPPLILLLFSIFSLTYSTYLLLIQCHILIIMIVIFLPGHNVNSTRAKIFFYSLIYSSFLKIFAQWTFLDWVNIWIRGKIKTTWNLHYYSFNNPFFFLAPTMCIWLRAEEKLSIFRTSGYLTSILGAWSLWGFFFFFTYLIFIY